MKTGRSCGGLGVRGPAARGRCGGRAGCPDPLKGASPQPYLQADTREAERGGPDARGTRETSSEPPAGARAGGRCGRPPLASSSSRIVMPRGAEALDLPVRNRASALSLGPRRRSVPRGRSAPSAERAMGPLPFHGPSRGALPPPPPGAAFLRGSSRYRTCAPISHPLRGRPPPGAPRGRLATRGKSLPGTPGRATTRRSW